MRLLLSAVNCPKGDISANLGRHRMLLGHGRDQACDLVLLPEMSLTGYRPSAAISLTHPAVAELVRATVNGPALCFGLVEDGAGAEPYIAQVVATEGQVQAVYRKAHLGEGESEHFRASSPSPPITVAGTSCAVAICAEIGAEAPYRGNADLVLGPAAPGLYGDRRRTEEDWRRG
ncbi:MAG: carbon-nitrogen hydrolase family protein, partial [Nocardioidaceae bacterium]